MHSGVGVVVIGRNEGERLRRCLRSLGEQVRRAVYVDSGSQDDSVAFARSLGAQVVELDTSIPFTAARARNEGCLALVAADAGVEWVQFVDGDCEVEAGWLERASQELHRDSALAVVFGRRRERQRDASVYNRLCDLEWDVPIGDVETCGGDAMMRLAPLRLVGGYDATLIAGEEPDLCRRLRAIGFAIRRIDAPMTVHDAAMHRFGQWWRRTMRAGYVEAEGVTRLGRAYPRFRSAVGNLFWAVAVPIVALAVAASAFVGGRPVIGALVLAAPMLLYLLQWWRIRRHASRRWPAVDAALYARYCVLGKWPSVHGMLVHWWRHFTRRQRRLIEYKGADGR